MDGRTLVNGLSNQLRNACMPTAGGVHIRVQGSERTHMHMHIRVQGSERTHMHMHIRVQGSERTHMHMHIRVQGSERAHTDTA